MKLQALIFAVFIKSTFVVAANTREVVVKGDIFMWEKIRYQLTKSTAPYIEVQESLRWLDAQVIPQIDTTVK